MPLSEHDKQMIRDRFETLEPAERKEFLDEMEEQIAANRRQREQPFPKLVKLYAHQSEEGMQIWDLNKALGLPEDERWNPLYEVEFIVEVPENPSQAKIIAVDGYMLDYSKKFDQHDEIVKVRS
jgi:hypothetical protein